MSDQQHEPRKAQPERMLHSEVDPPDALAAKVEALRACLKEELPQLVKQHVCEAVREEFDAARKQPEDGGLLTKEEVADWLQVSPRTVDTLAAGGELRKIKVRGCVRFSPGAVRAYIRRQAAGEGAA